MEHMKNAYIEVLLYLLFKLHNTHHSLCFHEKSQTFFLQVLQERGGANELAEDILFDLKSLLRDDRGAIRDPEKLRSVARSVLDEIDPDDPKRLLRIS